MLAAKRGLFFKNIPYPKRESFTSSVKEVSCPKSKDVMSLDRIVRLPVSKCADPWSKKAGHIIASHESWPKAKLFSHILIHNPPRLSSTLEDPNAVSYPQGVSLHGLFKDFPGRQMWLLVVGGNSVPHPCWYIGAFFPFLPLWIRKIGNFSNCG